MYPQNQHILLDRDTFRNNVFKRDKYTCVICGFHSFDESKINAHHIMERRLWDNGGYYLENGSTLCIDCHIKAETTVISCDEVRKASGIKETIIPFSLEDEYGMAYDKWGNQLLANGTRVKGELFTDKSVQKILEHGNVLHLFTSYFHYPRTFHLPWSEGLGKGDRVLKDLSLFIGKKVVVTEKMDGENSTISRDYMHARSINSGNHGSRTWLKNLHGTIRLDIPDGWRICGENIYAKHSIAYKNLKSYFMVFSIWDESNEALDWSETEEWCNLLGLKTVPVIYRGEWDEDKIKSLYKNTSESGDEMEGYVVRLDGKIRFNQFRSSCSKFVRANHIQTPHNWKNLPIVKNIVS